MTTEGDISISLTRSGGFAGMRMKVADVDTALLSPKDATALREIVHRAHFFQLPPVIAGPVPGADRFQYTLTVSAEGKRYSVEISEAAIPESLKPLFDYLMEIGRGRGGTPVT